MYQNLPIRCRVVLVGVCNSLWQAQTQGACTAEPEKYSPENSLCQDLSKPCQYAIMNQNWTRTNPMLYGWYWENLYEFITHALYSLGIWETIHAHLISPSNPLCYQLNSLWPSDAIWRQRSGSTLAQVMACCLTAPSHYLNLCWFIISKVQWHPSESNFYKRYLSHQSLKLAWKLLI